MKRVMALVPLLGLCLTACLADGNAGIADTQSGEGSDHSSPPETGLDDTGSSPEPAWFDLSGTVTLLEGQVASASLVVSALPEEPSDGVICSTTYEELVLTPVEPLPDPIVWHWWQAALPVESSDCEGADQAPRLLRLGLGELYPALEQGVEEHGLGHATASLYGAYASFEAPVGDGLDGTTYAYGYAGTEQDREGETVAVEAGPLPDGSYLISGYYLFRLAE